MIYKSNEIKMMLQFREFKINTYLLHEIKILEKEKSLKCHDWQ